ncbi:MULTISPECIES: hypothetical protein [unclassified Microbacterium]|uniref:hypothetical protein n=1 Tax=unclassified Microbacterium TaxID=2609290 RepID=UPI0036550C87
MRAVAEVGIDERRVVVLTGRSGTDWVATAAGRLGEAEGIASMPAELRAEFIAHAATSVTPHDVLALQLWPEDGFPFVVRVSVHESPGLEEVRRSIREGAGAWRAVAASEHLGSGCQWIFDGEAPGSAQIATRGWQAVFADDAVMTVVTLEPVLADAFLLATPHVAALVDDLRILVDGEPWQGGDLNRGLVMADESWPGAGA